MAKVTDQRVFRILDANVNRVKEGLRVCEDISRFAADKSSLTRRLKQCRHALTEAVTRLPRQTLLSARDVPRDIGRRTAFQESKRQNINDIFLANAQRVKESLRVLEELAKLFDGSLAERLKRLRYRFYSVEKDYFFLTKRI